MLSKVCKIEIEKEEYEIKCSIRQMSECEELYGENFIKLVKDAEQGEILPLTKLLSVCLIKDGKSVGIDFIKDLDFSIFQELFEPLIDVILLSFPQDGKKKVKVLTQMKK